MRDVSIGAAHICGIAHNTVTDAAGQMVNRLGNTGADVLWGQHVTMEVAG